MSSGVGFLRLWALGGIHPFKALSVAAALAGVDGSETGIGATAGDRQCFYLLSISGAYMPRWLWLVLTELATARSPSPCADAPPHALVSVPASKVSVLALKHTRAVCP